MIISISIPISLSGKCIRNNVTRRRRESCIVSCSWESTSESINQSINRSFDRQLGTAHQVFENHIDTIVFVIRIFGESKQINFVVVSYLFSSTTYSIFLRQKTCGCRFVRRRSRRAIRGWSVRHSPCERVCRCNQ
jgi:hypothetical protein